MGESFIEHLSYVWFLENVKKSARKKKIKRKSGRKKSEGK